jgi:hypothetical protein
VEKFTEAMDAGDHSAMADATPPSILQHIAESAGIEVDALRGILISQMETMLAGSSIVEYSIDAGEGAVFRELGDGTPYALLPTETVIMSQGTKVTSRSQSLAILDEDKWYLLRVSDPQQVAILRQVYPAFADIAFPEKQHGDRMTSSCRRQACSSVADSLLIARASHVLPGP